MTAYVLGIDFGSTTGKAVILDESGRILAACVSQKGAVSDEGVRAALGAALSEAGVALFEIARTVATGYGRRMLDIADRTITEITCHARGAVEMVPEARLVIEPVSEEIARTASSLLAACRLHGHGHAIDAANSRPPTKG